MTTEQASRGSSRDLAELEAVAVEIASTLGGTARMLGRGRPSAAIALGSRHVVLVCADGESLSLSLPFGRAWSSTLRPRGAWRSVVADVAAAASAFRAEHPRAASMADAVVAFAPVLERIGGRPWAVWFRGMPVPTRAELTDGERRVDLLQQGNKVKVAIRISSAWECRSASSVDALAALVPWLDEKVRRQDAALAAAAVLQEREEDRRRTAPRPSAADVTRRMRVGERFRTGGARYHESFYWDDRRSAVQIEVFDEGHVEARDATAAELTRAIDAHPDVFAPVEGRARCP